jgi:hypothetical protein
MSSTRPRSRRSRVALLCILGCLGAMLIAPSADAALIKQAAFPNGEQTGTARWSRPAGLYVVGTYFPGNSFWAQGPAENGWRWGYLGGDVHFCVWVFDANFPAGGTAADNRCPAPRKETGPYSFNPAQIWDNPAGNDGQDATLDPGACGGSTRRYANASPWTTTSLVHPMGDVLHAARPVKKRYLTGDRRVILVRDPALGNTGNYPSPWFFVPAACVR